MDDGDEAVALVVLRLVRDHGEVRRGNADVMVVAEVIGRGGWRRGKAAELGEVLRTPARSGGLPRAR